MNLANSITKSITLYLVAGIVFFVLGWLLVTQYASSQSLYASVSNPAGIAESMFLYDGFGNVELYLLYVIPYLVATINLTEKSVFTRFWFTGFLALTGGIIGNFVWLLLEYSGGYSGHSWGQSGVVYSFVGAVFAFALEDTIHFFGSKEELGRISNFLKTANKQGKVRIKLATISNLFIVFFVFYQLFTNSSAFFSASPTTNSLVHSIGFITALIGVYIYQIVRKPQNAIPWEASRDRNGSVPS